MKFALVGDIRTEASKGARGVCPSCGTELLAKCGDVRVDHWAHHGNRRCDQWWENETLWHRSWKNNFPAGWQEIPLVDKESGEKHIADIRTDNKLVIEFQHSHLKPQERAARETYYQNMVWVVDGSRLKRDYPRFVKAKEKGIFSATGRTKIFFVEFADECFPKAWLDCSVPVVFDFQGAEFIDNSEDLRESLYCLFPVRIGFSRFFAEISRSAFIKSTSTGEWAKRVQRMVEHLEEFEKRRQSKEALMHKQQMRNSFERILRQRERRFRPRKRRL